MASLVSCLLGQPQEDDGLLNVISLAVPGSAALSGQPRGFDEDPGVAPSKQHSTGCLHLSQRFLTLLIHSVPLLAVYHFLFVLFFSPLPPFCPLNCSRNVLWRRCHGLRSPLTLLSESPESRPRGGPLSRAHGVQSTCIVAAPRGKVLFLIPPPALT